jgi:hypothetical protein
MWILMDFEFQTSASSGVIHIIDDIDRAGKTLQSRPTFKSPCFSRGTFSVTL